MGFQTRFISDVSPQDLSAMKSYGTNSETDLPLWAEHISALPELARVHLPTSYTNLFIAADALNLEVGRLHQVAKQLLARGVRWVCVWGPGSQRLHDLFDEAHLGDGSIEPAFILMSTWHNDATIDEAIWFFLSVAFPIDTEFDETAYVAVSVGNTAWAEQIDRALRDQAALKTRIMGADSDGHTGG